MNSRLGCWCEGRTQRGKCGHKMNARVTLITIETRCDAEGKGSRIKKSRARKDWSSSHEKEKNLRVLE